MLDVRTLVGRVADTLRSLGIDPEGPVDVPATGVPSELATRASTELRLAWERGVARLSWVDDEERLGRDARGGELWFMTPEEALDEAREHAEILEDERTIPSALGRITTGCASARRSTSSSARGRASRSRSRATGAGSPATSGPG